MPLFPGLSTPCFSETPELFSSRGCSRHNLPSIRGDSHIEDTYQIVRFDLLSGLFVARDDVHSAQIDFSQHGKRLGSRARLLQMEHFRREGIRPLKRVSLGIQGGHTDAGLASGNWLFQELLSLVARMVNGIW